MERLTNRGDRGGIIIKDVVARLAAYEDSGLTPEEVAELKTFWDMYGGEEGVAAAFDAKAELEKIVRCKDCTEAQPDEMFGGYWCNGERVQGDHFCSCGEKKGE